MFPVDDRPARVPARFGPARRVAVAALTVATVVALAVLVIAPGGEEDAGPDPAAGPVVDGDGHREDASPAPGRGPDGEATPDRAEPPDQRAPVPEPRGRAVTLAFAGDVHFESFLRTRLEADPTGMLVAIAPVLAEADLTVVNLETAITEAGTPAPKEFVFRAPPSAFTALRAAGVDVASLANNHGMDFGRDGLEDTLDAAADAGFPIIGIGRSAAEAYAPYRVTIKGQRIAVIGATQVMDTAFIPTWTATDEQPGLASAKDEWEDRLADEVAEVRAGADTVVVFLHWGIERETCPSPAQQSLARRLVDAGADIIVGGHAHRLQGAGFLDDALVAYGLGNFVFYARPGPGAESGVLLVTVAGRDVERYEWRPARIVEGVPVPLDGDERDAQVEAWHALRDCTDLRATRAGAGSDPGAPPDRGGAASRR